jgi:hypothetical protein
MLGVCRQRHWASQPGDRNGQDLKMSENRTHPILSFAVEWLTLSAASEIDFSQARHFALEPRKARFDIGRSTKRQPLMPGLMQASDPAKFQTVFFNLPIGNWIRLSAT